MLYSPFSFDNLHHHYADSWRVPARESLLSVCGGEAEHRIPSKTFYAKDLEPQRAERARAVCTAAGVKDAAFLDACTIDVAMIGNDEATRVFVGRPPHVAVGRIVAGTTATAGHGYWRFGPWLLLLLILVVVIVWLLVKKR